MDDKGPSKMFRVLQILIPLASVAVAVTAILLTIASRKKELTCTLVNSTRLVSENLGGIHPDLHVEFHGQAIFSLTKTTFSLRNTGAAAVKVQDVVEPIRLKFPGSARLLSAVVEKTLPSDLKFSARVVPESGEVLLDFPLLNSNDEAFFSVYIFNSDSQRPTLEGRVVDVPQMVYSEINVSAAGDRSWPLQSHATRSVVRWILIVLYCSLAGVFLGVWVGGIVDYARYLPWKRKWSPAYDALWREWEIKARKTATAGNQGTNVMNSLDEGDEVAKRNREIEQAYLAHALAVRGPHFFRPFGFDEELKKKGIPSHPNPMVESLSGLAGFSVLMLSLAAIGSLTALIVYRALNG